MTSEGGALEVEAEAVGAGSASSASANWPFDQGLISAVQLAAPEDAWLTTWSSSSSTLVSNDAGSAKPGR
jgi:hypothetical protein